MSDAKVSGPMFLGFGSAGFGCRFSGLAGIAIANVRKAKKVVIFAMSTKNYEISGLTTKYWETAPYYLDDEKYSRSVQYIYDGKTCNGTGYNTGQNMDRTSAQDFGSANAAEMSGPLVKVSGLSGLASGYIGE
ncbi:uncharacterized protein F5147DRAFT_652953 [Suillus discolor]|uniref:Uncharacterized protein n=1 Tax=Suillus discolor TaxID=1912936 RepID=A0A9P7JTZ8_9AGAM|nr:uncharacterized protein F5147DRAFT_652953 [Suillus discolor]KAG2108231.1 hypothetical protein F5147DRAFT_652953 [Suillus discolor]